MEIAEMPAKNTISDIVFPSLNLPDLNSKNPTTRFTKAQITFVVDEDKPTPGGLAKGVGNLLPETPCTK